ELTEIQRVAITAFVLAGRKHKEAAAVFGCSWAAVTKTIQRFYNTQTFRSKPRKGRPDKLNLHEKSAIVRSAKINYRQTYRELAGQWTGRMSLYTIRRVLCKAHYRK
ncbi:hypothetical protein LY78DRAFT_537748, partial [Colletotrichum sublineola]